MCVSLCVCVCVDPNPREIQVSLRTWTRKGKDSNILLYIYIPDIYIDWYVTQKSKSGEFVGTFLLLLLLLLLLLSLCVCVYPCKQFVVVTIRRAGSWNTIPTLGTHLYRTLTRSTGIFYLRFIVWFLERTILLEDKIKQSPSEQISSLPENSLESITIQSNPHSASTVAALLNDIFTLVVVVVVIVITQKAEPNRTEEYIDLQGRSSLCLRSTLPFLAPTPNQYKRKKRKKTDGKKQQHQHQHQNHDPPPHGFHPIFIIINLLLLFYQTFRNHHQKTLSKSLSRRNGNHSL